MMNDSVLTESGRNKSMSEGRVGKEDKVTKAIEKETSKIPSTIFLVLAGGAIALSLGLALSKKEKKWANFTGLWAPTFLLLGIYNKIVKTHGSDKSEREPLLH
jgi:hypothetical protein